MNIAHMVKKASQQLTTVPVSVSGGAAGGAGAGAVGGGGGGTKENLYVIALPPDQLRYFGTVQIIVGSFRVSKYRKSPCKGFMLNGSLLLMVLN